MNLGSFLTTTTRIEISSPEWFWQGPYRAPYPNEQTVKPCHFHGTLGKVKVVPMAEYLLSNTITGDGGKTEERYTSQLGTNDTESRKSYRGEHRHGHSIRLCPGTVRGLSQRYQNARQVLVPLLEATAQDSEGKYLRPMSSGGAYSALEARPPSRGAGDRASFVDDLAETSPPRRSRSTDTDQRSDGVAISPISRDEYGMSETARRVVSEQEHSTVHTRVTE
jgi:hypothetical protein